jgi:hypothetical protein
MRQAKWAICHPRVEDIGHDPVPPSAPSAISTYGLAWHGCCWRVMCRKCVSPAQRPISGVRSGPDGDGSHARSRQHAISPQEVGVGGATRRGGASDDVPVRVPSTADAGAGRLGITLSDGWAAECVAHGHHQLRRSYPRPARARPGLISWWAGRDSNPHGSPHWILSPARLPVPPPARVRAVFAIVRRPFLSRLRLEPRFAERGGDTDGIMDRSP